MGGGLLRTLDLSAIPTSDSLVAGVTMAPSSNPNDSPSAMNYWIVDRHVDNNATTRRRGTACSTRCRWARPPSAALQAADQRRGERRR